MVNGILIDSLRSVYSENLLPELEGNIVVSTGTNANIAYNSSVVFDGLKSIKSIYLVSGGVDPVVFNISDYQTIIKNTGKHILSYRILNPENTIDVRYIVNMYVNGILLSNRIIDNDVYYNEETLYWNCYAQSFYLNIGDVITFSFSTTCDNVGSVSYIGGFKLEYDDRNLGTPSIYSKPLVDTTSYGFYTGWASYTDTQKTSGTPLNLLAGVPTPIRIRSNTIVDSQKPIDVDTFYVAGDVAVTSVTGTFLSGETITGGTSGATGFIARINTASNFGIDNYIGNFTGTETITGSISGATASFASISNGYITGRNGDNLDVMMYLKCLPSAINAEVDVWIEIGGAVGELYRETKYFRGTTEKGLNYSLSSGYTLGTWEANGGVIYLQSSVDMTVYDVSLNLDRSHKAR